jgi:transposase
VSDGVQDRKVDRLQAEVVRLTAENAELKTLLAEQQKALDVADADLARYRLLVEQQRFNRPERVSSVEQQLVLEGMLAALTATPAVNDSPATEPAASGPAAGAAPSPGGAPSDNSDGKERRRSRHGRRPLDISLLPVELVIIDPPEVVAAGGVGFTLVGEEAANRIARTPARFTCLRTVRRTFMKNAEPDAVVDAAASASLGAETASSSQASQGAEVVMPDAVFLTAPLPDALWPRVMADPSAIAHAIVSKYDDLLPLHRQQGITRREGFTIPRSTLCSWFHPAEDYLAGIVDAMFDDSKTTAPYVATDATGASVRGPKKTACEAWHVFVFVAQGEHIVFRYARTHDSTVLAAMLAGYRGLLLADASSIYSPLAAMGRIILACCWAHVRRYFFKAIATERTRSLEAIAIIGKLFEVERQCAKTPMPDKTARRAELAAPVLKMFDEWLDRNRPTAEPRTPFAAAITYADNQKVALRRFLEDGRLRLDNNVCEGQLRSLVLGQNNWQYFENETGLRWYTVFRSLIASCKLHGLCPERYLECVLRLAPHWSQKRLLELSPRYWRATAARLTPEQRAIVRPSWSSAFDVFVPAPVPEQAASTEPSSDVAAA